MTGFKPAYFTGYWSALATTVLGVIYFLVLLWMILSGQFTLPPPAGIQLFAGIISLLFCPLIVIIMASLHSITQPVRKVYTLAGFAFTLLFAASVSINRFTQLGAVRMNIDAGTTEALHWFLPYGDHSFMLGLEIMGWGWFLGLAFLAAAPLFSSGRLNVWIKWLMILYGLLGIVSSAGFLADSPVSAIGFIAWGLVLFLITGLLTVYFRHKSQADALSNRNNNYIELII